MDKKFHVTPYAKVPFPGGEPSPPSKIIFNDVTLREGEQSGDVNLTIQDRITLSAQLTEAGVDQIQCGFVGRSSSEYEFVRKLKAETPAVQVETLVIAWEDNWKREIEAGWECKADMITILIPGSEIRLKNLLGITQQQALKRASEAVRYAQNGPSKIVFGVTDSTRTEIRFLLDLYGQAVQDGCMRVYVLDTIGVANPRAIAYYVNQVRQNFNVQIGVHCHNDFGLACANTLSAIEQGAEVVDVAINGIGDRSGNAALEEVAAGLAAFYGLQLDIKLSKLYELSRSIAKVTGIEPGPTKAFVGTGAFSHKFDVHVHGVTNYPPAYEGMDPSVIGQKRQILLGKSSGLFTLRFKLKELGLVAPEEQLPAILNEIHSVSELKGRALDETTLREVVDKYK